METFRIRTVALLLLLLCWQSPAWSLSLPEYRLKAAFLINFAAFTQWPAEVGDTLQLCVYGQDPFGEDLDDLQGKRVGGRKVVVKRVSGVDSLRSCQIVFIARSDMSNLARVLDAVTGQPVLTVADMLGAARQGVILNMRTEQDKITFEANLGAARANGLSLSAKLLRLATEVIQ
jgi:YfiR/HmsC-like